MSSPPANNQPSTRIALWLDVDDLHWLAQYLADGVSPHSPSAQWERADRIRFWALAALSKAGHLSTTETDADAAVEE